MVQKLALPVSISEHTEELVQVFQSKMAGIRALPKHRE